MWLVPSTVDEAFRPSATAQKRTGAIWRSSEARFKSGYERTNTGSNPDRLDQF